MRHIDQYYTTEDYLEKLYDRNARTMAAPLEDLQIFGLWQSKARAKLSLLLHQERFLNCPLSPELIEEVSMEGYSRKKIIIQTEPEVWMPFFLLCPDEKRYGSKHPAVLFLPGHGPGKMVIVQTDDYAETRNYLDETGRRGKSAALRLVEQGYLVLVPDTRGAGERREKSAQGSSPEQFAKNCHSELNKIAICLGYSVTGMNVWDFRRALDYLELLPEYNGTLFCGGHSGGGHLAILLSAVDERVQAVFTSGYFYGFKDAFLHLPNNCSCNYVPDLWRYFDVADIGCMIAPRPFFIESGDQDELNGCSGLDNVYPQVRITEEAYKLYHCNERLTHSVYHGNHGDGMKDEKIIAFLNQLTNKTI